MMKDRDSTFVEWNEKMAHKYNPDDYHNSPNFIVRLVEGRRTDTLLKLLDAKQGERIIDLGCGAGNILERVACDDRWGVDLSDRMLGLAKARFTSAGISHNSSPVQLFKENVENLSDRIPPKTFDKAFSSEVIEHTEDPEAVLRETARIVKPGGVVIISIPNEKFINILKRILIFLRVFHFLFPGIPEDATTSDEWHRHSFSLKLLRSIAKLHLIEKRVVRTPFFFLPIRYVVRYSVPAALEPVQNLTAKK